LITTVFVSIILFTILLHSNSQLNQTKLVAKWKRLAYLTNSFSRPQGVTLATHLTTSKLQNLNEIMTRWAGPVVACIFMTPTYLVLDKYNELVLPIRERWKESLKINIFSSTDLYPINIVRNRALQEVNTTHVLMIDVDFIPDPGLYDYLMANDELYRKSSHRIAWVVASFIWGANDTNFSWSDFPKDKKEVRQLILDQRLYTSPPDFLDAQMYIDHFRWLRTNTSYAIERASSYFEPYYVVRLTSMPFYDERFRFYGHDKAQHFEALVSMNFRFRVLPEHFIIHVPHAEHEWHHRKRERAYVRAKEAMTEFYEDYGLQLFENKRLLT